MATDLINAHRQERRDGAKRSRPLLWLLPPVVLVFAAASAATLMGLSRGSGIPSGANAVTVTPGESAPEAERKGFSPIVLGVSPEAREPFLPEGADAEVPDAPPAAISDAPNVKPAPAPPAEQAASDAAADVPPKTAAPAGAKQEVFAWSEGERAPLTSARLEEDDRRDVQRRLSWLGFDVGDIDGVFGKKTRLAVVDWRRDNGLYAAARLTSDDISLLRRQSHAATVAEARPPRRIVEIAELPRPKPQPRGCKRNDRGRIIADISFSCDLEALGEALGF